MFSTGTGVFESLSSAISARGRGRRSRFQEIKISSDSAVQGGSFTSYVRPMFLYFQILTAPKLRPT